ncbi:hypothetical protein DVR12_05650 [Chitinophaga silvatica]|uniref:Uncharacterized protein n=1 Tax=Chitinophaga silvatica TaxID=2282649 RepID=A0A3E1YF28_9BACT|nr:hypothetical protein [Chitinophaga silvatica]RFS25128.1 hypothetical protein DVR12_05650 [Chitinophaga silvatica]
MTREEFNNLERLVNYISWHFLKKSSWEHVSKAEWTYAAQELNAIAARKHSKKNILPLLGDNYLYEHIIIKKLKAGNKQSLQSISSPNFSKLNQISFLLGYHNYIDFLNSAATNHPFQELKINIPLASPNRQLLDQLVGHWYCYNRNLSSETSKKAEERIMRSSLEIYKSGEEYLVERSGRDNHIYYGKITCFNNFIFIILNSTTFIRQRHFIGKVNDMEDKLHRNGYKIDELNFVSTCVSFNEEPIALYEIFHRIKPKEFQRQSIDLPFDSPLLPQRILEQLKDSEQNRITQH